MELKKHKYKKLTTIEIYESGKFKEISLSSAVWKLFIEKRGGSVQNISREEIVDFLILEGKLFHYNYFMILKQNIYFF